MSHPDDIILAAQLAVEKAVWDMIRVAQAAGYDVAIGEPCYQPLDGRQTIGDVTMRYVLIRPHQDPPPGRRWTVYRGAVHRRPE